ncbi:MULTISPECIES: hypothetical protein [Legionella]|uniref:Uncharacterized protein n=1 Tax=Legionella maceachernii TaxID=466 RepID=A0A0W0WG35_9GAMM|nr:hypothetical protein [Legionella maceachernii]KTD31309.1 hypothetical protein Lmac_0363 [Legionella maceachernii]SKA00014.1 hypothetical protein SAMN02745128_01725 [Legionella maceachernii]SUP01299.1 Uncharacterised protein [Legionella maceachernii]
MISFDEAEEQFERELNRYLQISFLQRNYLTVSATRKKEIVIKGRRFLKSLAELNRLNQYEREEDYTQILLDGIRVLKNPTSSDDYSSFFRKVEFLVKTGQENKNFNYTIAGLNMVIDSLHCATGVAFAIGGGLITWAAIDLIACGAALVLSPWGFFAFGVALGLMAMLGVSIILFGIIVANSAAGDIYGDYRFCRDRQLTEITEFVNFMNPTPLAHRLSEESELDFHQPGEASALTCQ